MSESAKILAAQLLEDQSSGACAQCEIDHYGKPVSDGSHGWCRRHLEAWLRDPRNEMTDEQVKDVLVSTKTTPPDLGPVKSAVK